MGGNQCLHYCYSHLSGVKDAIKVDIGGEASKLSGMKTIETAATESLYSAVYQAIAKKKNSTKVIVEKECTPNRIVVACGHGKVSKLLYRKFFFKWHRVPSKISMQYK